MQVNLQTFSLATPIKKHKTTFSSDQQVDAYNQNMEKDFHRNTETKLEKWKEGFRCLQINVSIRRQTVSYVVASYCKSMR